MFTTHNMNFEDQNIYKFFDMKWTEAFVNSCLSMTGTQMPDNYCINRYAHFVAKFN